ncbi:MAG: MerR family transcriptional regulator [Gammaproteobacteria bacterium]|nr:MerR family transcriptional regulator [Gammaproteobacteria bacterium]MCP5299649.1 MerR family transcriptional regulator [Chromatiaceae bacterium]
MPRKRQTLTEELLTLAELSRCCDVAAEKMLMLIAEGVVTPLGRRQREWRFDVDDVRRARSALRLERDLGINCAGAALAVDLLDETRRLRERVRLLENLLKGVGTL